MLTLILFNIVELMQFAAIAELLQQERRELEAGAERFWETSAAAFDRIGFWCQLLAWLLSHGCFAARVIWLRQRHRRIWPQPILLAGHAFKDNSPFLAMA